MSDGDTIWRRDGRNIEELPDPLGGTPAEPPAGPPAPEARPPSRRRYWKWGLYTFAGLVLVTLI